MTILKKIRRLIRKLSKSPKFKGFTLAELMMASAILSVVLTSYLQLFIYCSTLAETSANLSFAINAAQAKMEEIRNVLYDDIITTYDGVTFSLNLPPNADGEITVNEIGADVPGDLLEIDIDISWQNKNRRNATTSLISYIARR